MFNWYSLPTFAAMLLFWALAAYLLTRGPRSLVSLTAAGTQVAAAAYLLGQGMLANAARLAQWEAWARTTQWGIVVALVLWYWLTVLLLSREGPTPALTAWRRLGYALGVVLAVAGLALVASIYAGDSLYVWSAPVQLAPGQSALFRFRAPVGPLYGAFVALVWAAILGAALNVWIGWRQTTQERHQRFKWLLVGALLFVVGIGPTAVANWLEWYAWPTWLGHLAVAVAMVLMAANVAAFQLVLEAPMLRTDLAYYLSALASICLLDLAVDLVAAPAYSFRLLGLLVLTLILIATSHALIGPARQVFDRLFYADDVSRLRSSLTARAREAALTGDLAAVVSQAQSDLAAISDEHFLRLVEEALRRLNNPAALARCALVSELPRSLAAGRSDSSPAAAPTPLQQAHQLRELLVAGISQLKPPDAEARRGDPASLHYAILYDEYVRGTPNQQIMTRHAIGEGTFHRHRRAAIAMLAHELRAGEERLAPAASLLGPPNPSVAPRSLA
jgi:hypothetical protein